MKRLLLLCLLSTLTVAHAQTHWTPVTGFQYTMSVTGVITIDGVEQTSTNLEIGAFCGDECRGAKKAGFFPPSSQYTVPISIAGNSGDLITFRIYDHAQGIELELESVNTLSFQIDAIIGTMGNWYQFGFITPSSPASHFTTAGNWSMASNWQGGALPGANDVVFIDANCTLDQDATVTDLTVSTGFALTLQTGKKLTVTGTLTNAAETGLVINDGAQLINTSANVAATMVMRIEAYTSNADGWYTIASLMNEMSIAGSDFLTPIYDLYRFNEANTNNDEWENYKANHPDFTTFENGRGYLYANSNTFSPEFKGTLNNATVKYDLSYTVRPDNLSGFNLIGNPFPHVIYKGAGGAIDDAKLSSGFYTLTNEGAWHVHTFEDAIQPGQGILVKTTAATELSINKSNVAASSETVGAKSSAGRLNISVTGNQTECQVFAYFCQGVSLDKMDNLSEQAPSLWIRDNGNDYTIAHIDNDYESLDVFFDNNQSGDFTMEVSAKDTNFSYLQLVDNIAGEVVDLLEQPSYTFYANGNEMDARFKLVFKTTIGVEETEDGAPFAFISDGKLILTGVDDNVIVQVIDALGRIIVNRDGVHTVSTSEMVPGVYVLRLIDGNDVRTQKIVIK